MKRILNYMLIAMVAMTVAIGFASCDSDIADPKSHDSDLIGTWSKETHDFGFHDKISIKFNNDGSFVMEELNYYSESGDNWSGNWKDADKYTMKGKWQTKDDDEISLKFDKNSPTYYHELSGTYRIEGKTLIMNLYDDTEGDDFYFEYTKEK